MRNPIFIWIVITFCVAGCASTETGSLPGNLEKDGKTQVGPVTTQPEDLRKIKELAWRLGQRRQETIPRSCDVRYGRTISYGWNVNPLYLKLLKFGKRAVPVLLEVYKDGNPLAKRSVVCALGHMHDPDLRDFFLKATREKDPRLSIIAHWSLIYLKDRELIPFFLKNLQDPRNPRIRGYAALALAKFQDKSLIKPLRKALRIKDKARREIILALQELNATEAVGDLIEMYYDNPALESAPLIVVCVGKLDGKARVAFLTDCLKSRNPAVVIQALEALGQAGDKSCIPAVKRLLRSAPKKEVVLPVVGATLCRLGDKTGLQILDRGLGGEWPNRLAYAYELGRLRKKAATGMLLEKLLSKDEIPEDLRRRILQALGDTGDKSVLPVLVSSLGKDHEGNYWAIKSIEKLTGLDFKCPWLDSATETERKKIVENVRSWWRQHKAKPT
ncbi:MAG: HEAT repeat domain-containing protein [Phycisphaerae bacterium]|nr:HEAT repeat domain-containing protein [Phycisphaerae bacterium]